MNEHGCYFVPRHTSNAVNCFPYASLMLRAFFLFPSSVAGEEGFI